MELEAKNGCADEGQQQFNRQTNTHHSQSLIMEMQSAKHWIPTPY
jgi:hypothetical protein